MDYINPYRLFVGAFVPNWLMEWSVPSMGAKLCYAKLCQFADKDSGIAWPSVDVLAEGLGVDERQARRYTKELEDIGLIEVERKGLGMSNRYRFKRHEVMSVQDRTHMSDPERTDMSGQERSHMSDPIYRKESIEKNQLKRTPLYPLEKGKRLELPDILEPHREAIEEWLAYKREKGQTYKPRGLAKLLKDLESMPNPTSAIHKSMACNYAGVFDKGVKPAKESFEDKARRLGLA